MYLPYNLLYLPSTLLYLPSLCCIDALPDFLYHLLWSFYSKPCCIYPLFVVFSLFFDVCTFFFDVCTLFLDVLTPYFDVFTLYLVLYTLYLAVITLNFDVLTLYLYVFILFLAVSIILRYKQFCSLNLQIPMSQPWNGHTSYCDQKITLKYLIWRILSAVPCPHKNMLAFCYTKKKYIIERLELF